MVEVEAQRKGFKALPTGRQGHAYPATLPGHARSASHQGTDREIPQR